MITSPVATAFQYERPRELDMSLPTVPQWRKELFHRQPFPDNYSGGDECFLNEMRKNVSAVTYSLHAAVLGACHLVAHFNAVILYFVLFEAIYGEVVAPNVVLWCFIATATSVYLTYQTFLSDASKWPIVDHLRVLATLLVFGYALTPIIRTLTTEISTDTIYASAIMFALVSCIFRDYGIRAPIVSVPVSVSCGLSSSVLLISRLPSSPPAFLLLAIAFALHSYWPPVSNAVMMRCAEVEAVVSLLLSVAALLGLFWVNPVLSMLWFLSLCFIIVGCPLLLVHLQKHKSTIHGPWDEAVPARSASDFR